MLPSEILVDTLDAASSRRFDLKIKFDYLKPDQSWILTKQILLNKNIHLNCSDDWKKRLRNLRKLTPGDFATVLRRNRITGDPFSMEELYKGLEAEVAFKDIHKSSGSVGFV